MALFRTSLHFEISIQVPQIVLKIRIFEIIPSGTPDFPCLREKFKCNMLDLSPTIIGKTP